MRALHRFRLPGADRCAGLPRREHGTWPRRRCFEGEDLTITAAVRVPGGLRLGGLRLDEITIQLETAQQVSLTNGTSTFMPGA